MFKLIFYLFNQVKNDDKTKPVGIGIVSINIVATTNDKTEIPNSTYLFLFIAYMRYTVI